MKKIIISIIILILFAGVFVLVIKKSDSGDLRPTELTYLRAAISQEDVLNYSNIEVPGLENITIKDENGLPYLALRTYAGQPLTNSGTRAEISIDYPYKEGDVISYSWQVRLPENFQSDAPQNRWWIMGQWHNQPDITKGETWDTYRPESPSLGFGYAMLEGKDVLGFIYGPRQKTIGMIPITRGEWHTIVVNVSWSQGENGKAEVFFDDVVNPVFKVSGQNMLNSYQHYLKIGSYHHKDMNVDSTVNIRNVTVKKLK